MRTMSKSNVREFLFELYKNTDETSGKIWYNMDMGWQR